MSEKDRIIVITAGGAYAWVIVNALASRFKNLEVLLEEPESKAIFLKRRARKLGWLQTIGQFGTMVISRFGKRFAGARSRQIIAEHGIDPEPLKTLRLTRVTSANGDDCLDVIADRKPKLVVLVGCRMLIRPTLAAMPCPVINYHSGINPKYRGHIGGWCGRIIGDYASYVTTVHLVDPGVDTGDTLHQAFLTPHPRETLLTDSLAMAAGSRDMVVRTAEDALGGNLRPTPSSLPSVQRFHPPIWTYLATGLFKRIW